MLAGRRHCMPCPNGPMPAESLVMDVGEAEKKKESQREREEGKIWGKHHGHDSSAHGVKEEIIMGKSEGAEGRKKLNEVPA